MTSTPTTPHRYSGPLHERDIQHYYQQGYISPFTIIPAEDMAVIRDRIDNEVLHQTGPNPKSTLHCRHLDHDFLADLCRQPRLVQAAQQLMGTDLQVWSSNFWLKEAGGTAVPWHQDINYWPINPPLNLTFWIAIDTVTRENSCVQVIPGSHRRMYKHSQVEGQMLSEEAHIPDDEKVGAQYLELEPGQAAIFNERLLHHSAPNTSHLRRLGFGIRIIPPFVAVDHDKPPLFPGHAVLTLCGEDRFGLNRIAQPCATS